MGITEALETILGARYGRDVRQAIHDGIKQAYEDGTANGNANMEVSQARGSYPTLDSRLDASDDILTATTAQLAQKANKSDIGAPSQSQVDDWLARNPSATTTVEDDSLETAKYKDESVTGLKILRSDLEVGEKSVAVLMSEDVSWVNQGINASTGELLEPLKNDRASSGFVKAIKLTVNPSVSGWRYAVYQYNLDESYVGQYTSGVTDKEMTLPDGFLYRILYAYDRPIPHDFEKIGKDFSFYKPISPIKLQNGSVGLNNLKSEVFAYNKKSKFVHLSADDVIEIFEDIYVNDYPTIFNNDVLSFLKQMNEDYGMVFSMYVWYGNETDSFNLSMFSNKYSNEFKENAHWLKFGVHYLKRDGGNFKKLPVQEGVTVYQNIMNNLFRITGGVESLDFVPRLHNFAGSEDFILEISKVNLGLKGLITSEDDRENYNLTDYENSYMQLHDRMSKDQLVFFSTDLRIENVKNVTNTLVNRVNNVEYASRSNDLLLFTHEQHLSDSSIQAKIIEVCEFANSNGYSFDFPQNKITL